MIILLIREGEWGRACVGTGRDGWEGWNGSKKEEYEMQQSNNILIESEGGGE